MRPSVTKYRLSVAVWGIFCPPPTHQDLASRIGSQREAVSKELKRLERDGVITRGRATIHLVREGVLRQEIVDWDDEPTCSPAGLPL
jgi:hypothetical protein